MQSGMGTQSTPTIIVMFSLLCFAGEKRGSLCYSLYVSISLKYFITYYRRPPKKDKEKKVYPTFLHHSLLLLLNHFSRVCLCATLWNV